MVLGLSLALLPGYLLIPLSLVLQPALIPEALSLTATT